MPAGISAWRKASPVLEQDRLDAIRAADTPTSLALLESAFQSATYLNRPAPSSGLVTFQQLLKKLHD